MMNAFSYLRPLKGRLGGVASILMMSCFLLPDILPKKKRKNHPHPFNSDTFLP